MTSAPMPRRRARRSLTDLETMRLAEWLTYSRSGRLTLAEQVPLEELMLARNNHLMGVTGRDVEVAMQHLATRIGGPKPLSATFRPPEPPADAVDRTEPAERPAEVTGQVKTDPDMDLHLTALHEGAHLVAEVWLGGRVVEASIRPGIDVHNQGLTLGHMCYWPRSDPRPIDCWVGSKWIETDAFVTLAGYEYEAMLLGGWSLDLGLTDIMHVVAVLRILFPRDPQRALDVLEDWRARVRRFLETPEVEAEIDRAADLLLDLETADRMTIYERLYSGRCSSPNPDDPGQRCVKTPHPFGDHFHPDTSGTGGTTWEGLPRPDRKMRVGSMVRIQKKLRNLNLGGPPEPLTQAWLKALDAYDRRG
jgi:hypothetical protein